MSELPVGWEETEIGEIARIETGNTPSKSNPKYYGREVCFFKPGDLDVGGVVSQSADMVSEAGAAAGRLLPADTLLVTCIGNLGKSALVGAPAICNQQINAVFPTPAADPRYLYHWSRTIRPWLEEHSSATTVSIINKGRFATAPIRIAPLAEQRRIVAKIDSLSGKSMRARDHLDHIPRLVGKYKQAILAAAFRGHWKDDETTTLGECSEFATSGSRGWAKFYSADGARFVRVGNVQRANISLNWTDTQRVSPPDGAEGQRTSVRSNDLVITITADLGRVGLVPSDISTAYVNQHVALVRLKTPKDAKFVAWYLASDVGQEQLLERNRGATRAGLGLDDIRAVRVPVASPAVQRAIIGHIENTFTWIDRLAFETTSARKLVDHLDQAVLAKAFRGELVPQDPNDEPASALLEKIRMGRGSQSTTGRARKRGKNQPTRT